MRHRRKRILKRRRSDRRRQRAFRLPTWGPLRLDNPARLVLTLMDFVMHPSPETTHALAHEIGACFGIDHQAVLSVDEAADALIACVVDVCRAMEAP